MVTVLICTGIGPHDGRLEVVRDDHRRYALGKPPTWHCSKVPCSRATRSYRTLSGMWVTAPRPPNA
jgi:hypothetical protein